MHSSRMRTDHCMADRGRPLPPPKDHNLQKEHGPRQDVTSYPPSARITDRHFSLAVGNNTRKLWCLRNFSACPMDTYSTGGDRTSCELCPVHSHTAGSTGVTSVNGCVCLPGFRRYYFGGPCQGNFMCCLFIME